MTSSSETIRFQQKRADIVDAATELINDRGVKGMTFVEVANMVGLNTTSVTYYFRRKEKLAAAVFESTLEQMEQFAVSAADEPDPRARVRKWMSVNFDLHRRIRSGEGKQLAVLSEMRTLDDDLQQELTAHYLRIFRTVRGYFGEPQTTQERAYNTARTHMLFEIIFWLPAWLPRYSRRDFARVEHRLIEFLENGIALPDKGWKLSRLETERAEAAEDAGRRNFLRVATVLINQRGYRGASVDRIASELNVTKGSFYHHLDAKDDLVLECFARSYDSVSEAQYLAEQRGGNYWERLTASFSALLHRQFFEDIPLLRTTALQALPPDVRARVLGRSNRLALRFAGMIIDGISEGSVRTIDPLLASQSMMAMLNSAYELRGWASRLEQDEAIAIYATPLCFGLFAKPMTD